jgi:hypothetical protein
LWEFSFTGNNIPRLFDTEGLDRDNLNRESPSKTPPTKVYMSFSDLFPPRIGGPRMSWNREFLEIPTVITQVVTQGVSILLNRMSVGKTKLERHIGIDLLQE